MARNTAKREPPDVKPNAPGFGRYWPLARGNSFRSLVDPAEYTKKLLKERTVTLKGLAVPRLFTKDDPLESTDGDM